MKKLLFTLIAISATVGYGATKRINAANTNIPGTYSTAAGSLVLSELKNPKSLFIDNRTGTEIEVNCTHNHNVLPQASEKNAIYVNASSNWVIDQPRAMLGSACYIRSIGSTISTGIVVITATDDGGNY